MTRYKEAESPIEEVYRIREEILKKFNYDIKAYHRHLRKTQNKWVKAGFHFADKN
jgi:hypothetical protein